MGFAWIPRGARGVGNLVFKETHLRLGFSTKELVDIHRIRYFSTGLLRGIKGFESAMIAANNITDDMDIRGETIKYLEDRFEHLEQRREALSQELHAVNDAITGISKTLNHLKNSEADVSVLDRGDDISVRKPDDCKRTIYKEVRLADAIAKAFKKYGKLSGLGIDALTEEIYATSNDEEAKACRASLTTALHRMEKSGIAKRVDAGFYSLNFEAEQDAALTEQYKKEVTQ